MADRARKTTATDPRQPRPPTPTHMQPAAAAAPAAGAADPLVEQAAKFLVHASTQATAIADRIAFLKSKGLSQPQISQALQQCGLPDPGASAVAPDGASPTSHRPQRQWRFIMAVLDLEWEHGGPQRLSRSCA